MFNRYLKPLLIIFILAFVLNWIASITPDNFNFLIIITRCFLLFYFGISLSFKNGKKNQAWLSKIIISFVVIFFLVWELDYIMIPQLKNFFDFVGFNGYIIYLIYIYCGYCFFQ